MKNTPKPNQDDAWDKRKLGASKLHARKASPAREKALDDNMGLQTISIRLQKSLIEDLKQLAETDGIGYQPYVRQLLTRHVRQISEIKRENRKVKTRKAHTGAGY
jgi:predicted DNA binding CopG/RHH family protein